MQKSQTTKAPKAILCPI